VDAHDIQSFAARHPELREFPTMSAQPIDTVPLPATPPRRRRHTLPAVFLAPSLLFLVTMAMVPTLGALNLAFRNRVLRYEDSKYVGLRNFARVLHDERFWNALKVSAIWEALTVAGAMGLGLLVAAYLFETTRGRLRAGLTVLLLVPVLLPRVSAAFMWKFMFTPLFGFVSWLLAALGIHAPPLLSDPATALYAVAMVDVWQWAPFVAAIVLKLLEALPPQPFEAARLDKARTWQIYAYIALPMLRVPLMSLVFIKMVESFRSFDLIYVMTKGGPGVATETLDLYAYSQGIGQMGKVSYASAMAVLMMLVTTALFTLIWKRTAKWD
jgi:multiple sugar transport system permease protein